MKLLLTPKNITSRNTVTSSGQTFLTTLNRVNFFCLVISTSLLHYIDILHRLYQKDPTMFLLVGVVLIIIKNIIYIVIH